MLHISSYSLDSTAIVDDQSYNYRDEESRFERLIEEIARDTTRLVPQMTLHGQRFVVKRLLGKGGMGAVYEAFDKTLNKAVALKTLRLDDPTNIYLIKQEFRALVDVKHPNLVALHGLFFDQGRWFFTMDLVAGNTLLRRLGASIDDAVVRHVFRQLAMGIHAIHNAGKIHRDLKTNNVLLTPDDRVVILDFGLVCDREAGGVGQTVSACGINGTPVYMAPEQAATGAASPASDWYAFGVMLFEVLTGRLPFDGSDQLVLVRKQKEEPPRASSLRGGIPEDLERLCGQLLQRDPTVRPGFGTIGRVLGSIPVHFTPPDRIKKKNLFIARINELSTLQTALEDTDEGQPVAVFVRGRKRAGKSTLIERFLEKTQCEGRTVVLTGRCFEHESVPFKACDSLIDSLSRYLRRLSCEEAALLLPRRIHALASLFPTLRRLGVISRIKQRWPLPSDPRKLRSEAFLALKGLLANIAEQERLVIFVDDLQWSDIDGAQLLSSTLSAPDAPPLLLIGAYRCEDSYTSTGLNILYERIIGQEKVKIREIELEKLSQHCLFEPNRDRLPNALENHSCRIAEKSNGLPYFIAERVCRAKTDRYGISRRESMSDSVRRGFRTNKLSI